MHRSSVLSRAAIAAAALIVIPSPLGQSPLSAAPSGWTPVWSDEFDGSTLDAVKWRALNTNSPANNEQQAYRPGQVTLTGGNLVITAAKTPTGGKPYVSGRVESNYEHQFGRWEFRADLPSTKGTWPALWLLPDTRGNKYPWPSQGEIDVVENRGQQPNLMSSAFHFGDNSPYVHNYVYAEHTEAKFGAPVNFHTSFHDYAVEWDATKLRFFVDDVHWYTVYNSGSYAGNNGTSVGGFLGSQAAPMQAVLNVAVGGIFFDDQGQPDASSVWPQQMLVDYVRVFDRDQSARMFANGDFEARDGSLAQWSVFGNVNNTNNVSVHNEAAHGGASLKLFGQFQGGTTQSGASQGITVAPGDEVKAIASRFIRSADSIAGTANTAQMKIEFFSDFGAKSGAMSPTSVVIANASSPNDSWNDFSLSAVAPANAVEARLSFIFSQSANGGGAVHFDDVSFVNERLAASADFNLDGVVDADDLAMLQSGFGLETGATRDDGDATGDGLVDGADLLQWQTQSSSSGASATPTSAAIPEPSSSSALWSAAITLLGGRRAMSR